MKCQEYLPGAKRYCGAETNLVCSNCKKPICQQCLWASRSPHDDLCLKCHEAAYYAYMKMVEEEKRRRGW